MRLKESLIRNLVFPLIDIANRESVLRYLDLYEKSQWWNLEKLERMQEKKLRALIRYAWNNVPYYRRIFKTANVKPEEIKNIEDLENIPILTHENGRRYLDDLIAVNIPRRSLTRFQTGGATGHPLLLYKDKNEIVPAWHLCTEDGGGVDMKLEKKWLKSGVYLLQPQDINC